MNKYILVIGLGLVLSGCANSMPKVWNRDDPAYGTAAVLRGDEQLRITVPDYVYQIQVRNINPLNMDGIKETNNATKTNSGVILK